MNIVHVLVPLLQLMNNIDTYLTLKSILYSDCLDFDLISYFWSRIQSRLPHHISYLYHWGLFLARIVLRLPLCFFFFFITFTVVRSTSWVLWKMYFIWDLLNVFLVSLLGLWVLGNKPAEVKFIEKHMKSTWLLIVDVILDHLIVVFGRSLPVII